MQWDGSLPNGGFTTGRPWLPVGTTTSVRAQEGDASSLLSLYRRLLELRRSHAALVRGTIANVAAQGDVLTYERCHDDERLLIALNMGRDDATVSAHGGVVLLSTLAGRDGQPLQEGVNRLSAGEAFVAAV